MEAINLKEAMILNPDRVRPEPYHDRLGQQLDPSLSKVYEQIKQFVFSDYSSFFSKS